MSPASILTLLMCGDRLFRAAETSHDPRERHEYYLLACWCANVADYHYQALRAS